MEDGSLLVAILGVACAVALAVARLPDLGDPGTVPLIGALFGFLGAAGAKLQGKSSEEVQRAAFDAGFAGTGFGLVLYLAAIGGVPFAA